MRTFRLRYQATLCFFSERDKRPSASPVLITTAKPLKSVLITSYATVNRFASFDPSTPTPPPKRHRAHGPRNAAALSTATVKTGPVEVYYRVKFPETEGTKFIPRHTPTEQLAEIPEIKELADNFGGNINISPARSACTEMEIRVETSFMDLIRRMKTAIKDEIESQMAETYSTKQENEYIILVAKYASIRSIEDWCLDRMKRIARIKGDATHKQTVETFLKSYNAINIPKEYLLSLKSSAARDIAANFIHVNPNNDEAINSLWKSLKCQLSEDDVQKYKALMKFGRGYTQVQYLGK